MNPKVLIVFPLVSLLFAGTAHAQEVNMPVGSNTSSNWAGYVANSSDYRGVGATWSVPTATNVAPSGISADATWVGIGGLTSNDLIQAGTQIVTDNGSVEYEAWYETLPNAQEMVPFTVHAGDSVSV